MDFSTFDTGHGMDMTLDFDGGMLPINANSTNSNNSSFSNADLGGTNFCGMPLERTEIGNIMSNIWTPASANPSQTIINSRDLSDNYDFYGNNTGTTDGVNSMTFANKNNEFTSSHDPEFLNMNGVHCLNLSSFAWEQYIDFGNTQFGDFGLSANSSCPDNRNTAYREQIVGGHVDDSQQRFYSSDIHAIQQPIMATSPCYVENPFAAIDSQHASHLVHHHSAGISNDALGLPYETRIDPRALLLGNTLAAFASDKDFGDRRTEQNSTVAQLAIPAPTAEALVAEPRLSSQSGHKTKSISRENNRLTCPVLNCQVTFGRKAELLRHQRSKHAQDAPKFLCPLVNCIKGEGHVIQTGRHDKVFKHIESSKAFGGSWNCIIPGCDRVSHGLDGTIDHIGKEHDFSSRKENCDNISIYFGDQGYLIQPNLCAHPMCPFGTDSLEILKLHEVKAHRGPLCPCPIPTCEHTFKDWKSVAMHLSRSHDLVERSENRTLLASFGISASSFICPICQIRVDLQMDSSGNVFVFDNGFRKHMTKQHAYHELKAAAQSILSAWRGMWDIGEKGRKHCLGGSEFTNDYDKKLFALITWPIEDVRSYTAEADFDALSAEVEKKANARTSDE